MKKHLIKILFIVILFSCKKERTEDLQKDKNMVSAMALEAPEIVTDEVAKKEYAPNVGLNQNQPKKVIYTANIKYRVADVKESEKKIKELVSNMKGYISNSSQNNEDGNLNTSLTIRIPIEKFDGFINGSEKESISTDYKNINSDDVSEEFYDNEIRLKSKRAAFEKYLALLKQAKNVTEVMAVEEQIRIIQEEIDSKEGRQKFINNQVAFSTVTLTIYQVIASNSGVSLPFYTKIWEQFTGGIQSYTSFFIGIFYFIPYILTLLVIWYLFKRWRNRVK
jgi:hypothetical protein